MVISAIRDMANVSSVSVGLLIKEFFNPGTLDEGFDYWELKKIISQYHKFFRRFYSLQGHYWAFLNQLGLTERFEWKSGKCPGCGKIMPLFYVTTGDDEAEICRSCWKT